MNIEELIKDLDKNLKVNECKKTNNVIYIYCEMSNKESACPYCGKTSEKIHSKYNRTLSDLPIQNNEVKLIINTRKFFCYNPECNHKTFSERFSFSDFKAVKTNRLSDYINSVGLRDNSMDAVRTLKETGIKVSSNTVLRIVKKSQKLK